MRSMKRHYIFSKIVLVCAYNQILIAPNDREKTETPFGLFGFNFIPFSLQNAT